MDNGWTKEVERLSAENDQLLRLHKGYEELIEKLEAENKSLKEQLHKNFEESIAVIHDEGAKRIMAEEKNKELLEEGAMLKKEKEELLVLLYGEAE